MQLHIFPLYKSTPKTHQNSLISHKITDIFFVQLVAIAHLPATAWPRPSDATDSVFYPPQRVTGYKFPGEQSISLTSGLVNWIY
jgi:hypothetical protein